MKLKTRQKKKLFSVLFGRIFGISVVRYLVLGERVEMSRLRYTLRNRSFRTRHDVQSFGVYGARNVIDARNVFFVVIGIPVVVVRAAAPVCACAAGRLALCAARAAAGSARRKRSACTEAPPPCSLPLSLALASPPRGPVPTGGRRACVRPAGARVRARAEHRTRSAARRPSFCSLAAAPDVCRALISAARGSDAPLTRPSISSSPPSARQCNRAWKGPQDVSRGDVVAAAAASSRATEPSSNGDQQRLSVARQHWSPPPRSPLSECVCAQLRFDTLMCSCVIAENSLSLSGRAARRPLSTAPANGGSAARPIRGHTG